MVFQTEVEITWTEQNCFTGIMVSCTMEGRDETETEDHRKKEPLVFSLFS
jgi:hypothetical protein